MWYQNLTERAQDCLEVKRRRPRNGERFTDMTVLGKNGDTNSDDLWVTETRTRLVIYKQMPTPNLKSSLPPETNLLLGLSLS